MSRRKVSAALNDFSKELSYLRKIDTNNQQSLSSSANRSQLMLTTEGLFFRAFRAYENFIEDVFILFVMEKPTISGNVVKSYLRPDNFKHARDFLLSEKRFLDWTEPSKVIERAETFLQGGGTVKNVLVSATQDLRDMKVVRNHIAHNSNESDHQFRKLIQRVRGTYPMKRVTPADHLLSQVKRSSTHYLEYYFDVLSDVCEAIAEK